MWVHGECHVSKSLPTALFVDVISFQIVYAAVTMFRWSDLVRSQSGLGVAGVLLVILTIGPGLGLCALVGIHFNASTSHIVPYLALGLGVDAMFILAHSYSEQWDSTIPDQVGKKMQLHRELYFA